MELQFPTLTLFLTFFLFLFMLINVVQAGSKSKKSSQKLPPGPWRLPLIGNLHQLVGSLPHRGLRDLARKYGPLMHLQIGEVSTIVVSSAEIAKEVLKSHDTNFAGRPSLFSLKFLTYDYVDIAFAPYGNYWRQLRKICTTHLLSAKRVQSFRFIREEEGSKLIKSLHSKQGSVINLSEKILAFTYGITTRVAVGSTCEDQEALISFVMEILKADSGFCLADLYPSIKLLQDITGYRQKLEKLHRKSDRKFGEILNEHKERRRTAKTGQAEAEEDIVDVFLNLQQDDNLEFSITDDHIKAVIWDIFTAGSETSSVTVEWAMAEMMKNPRVMKEAQAEVRRVFHRKGNVDETNIDELKFLKLVVKETLRLHPAAPILLPRESRESCEIEGYEIPKKTRVLVNAWAIARDQRYWNDAETFYPERFSDSSIGYRGTDFEYIPFGAGRRICPGITFALPNIELPLAQLLYHFDWKLPNGMKQEDLDMSEAFGLTVKKEKDLLLIPIPYRPYFFNY